MSVNLPAVLNGGVAGLLAAGAGQITFAAPFAGRVRWITAAVGTAPVGSAITLDVNVNGTSVFATNPTIADGATSGAGTDVVATEADRDFNVGDLITVDIDAVGSTTAGSDLVVSLVVDGDTTPGA